MYSLDLSGEYFEKGFKEALLKKLASLGVVGVDEKYVFGEDIRQKILDWGDTVCGCCGKELNGQYVSFFDYDTAYCVSCAVDKLEAFLGKLKNGKNDKDKLV